MKCQIIKRRLSSLEQNVKRCSRIFTEDPSLGAWEGSYDEATEIIKNAEAPNVVFKIVTEEIDLGEKERKKENVYYVGIRHRGARSYDSLYFLGGADRVVGTYEDVCALLEKEGLLMVLGADYKIFREITNGE